MSEKASARSLNSGEELRARSQTKPPAPAMTRIVRSAIPARATVMTRSVNSWPPSSSFIARASDGMSTALRMPPAART